MCCRFTATWMGEKVGRTPGRRGGGEAINMETGLFFAGSARAQRLAHFLFQRLEFLLAFVRMNALTYEWSLVIPPPASQPINAAVPGNLATVGGACAASSQSHAVFFYSGFSSCFSFTKKKRERRKVTDGEREEEKNAIHKKKSAPARKVLTCFSFFSARMNSKNLTLFTSNTRLSTYRKTYFFKKCSTAATLDISAT